MSTTTPHPPAPRTRPGRRAVAALGLVVAGSVVALPACGGRDREDRNPGLVTTLPNASTSSSTTMAPQTSTSVPMRTSIPGAAPGQGSDVDPPDPAPTPSDGGMGGTGAAEGGDSDPTGSGRDTVGTAPVSGTP